LDEIDLGQSFTFDEVHTSITCVIDDSTFDKRRPPMSLPTASRENCFPETRGARTSPSTFLFLPIQLSNNPEA
jgi:hypothetical protein